MKRPSVIHPGDQADDLRSIRLPHGATQWNDDVLVGSSEGAGFTTLGFAGAPDGLVWQTEDFLYGVRQDVP